MHFAVLFDSPIPEYRATIPERIQPAFHDVGPTQPLAQISTICCLLW